MLCANRQCTLWIALGLAVIALVYFTNPWWRGGDARGQQKGGASHSKNSAGSGRDEGLARLSAMSDHGVLFEKRLRRWMDTFESRLVEDKDYEWRPGATSEEIAEFEKWAGEVPLDLRLLLMVHNGQARDPETPLFWVNRLLSSEEIARETDELQEIHEDVGLSPGEIDGTVPVSEAAWWHKDLMLFLADDNGGGVAVDRKTGAVWDWDHDGGIFGMLAPDIGTFFDLMTAAYEEGKFTVEDAGSLLLLPELKPDEEQVDQEPD